MKVFVSSVISGFTDEREAACEAVASLGLELIRAENFGASAGSPQVACLDALRRSDLVVLVLGERYGYVADSGLSATHEEYREARDRVPVLAFVQAGITPEPAQGDFIAEVQAWEKGHFTATFRSPDELRKEVTRAVHEHTLSSVAGPVDSAEVLERARALAAAPTSIYGTSSPELAIAVAGGPLQSILRPAEIEGDGLRQRLLAHALTGPEAVLSTTAGTDVSLEAGSITLVQQGVVGALRLTETGDVLILQPAADEPRQMTGIRALIEEQITQRITRALRLAAVILDEVDSTNRISDVAVVACLRGTGYMSWRTQAEHDRSPNSGSIGGSRGDGEVVHLSPPMRRRQALKHETHQLAEDLTVRLRQAQR